MEQTKAVARKVASLRFWRLRVCQHGNGPSDEFALGVLLADKGCEIGPGHAQRVDGVIKSCEIIGHLVRTDVAPDQSAVFTTCCWCSQIANKAVRVGGVADKARICWKVCSLNKGAGAGEFDALVPTHLVQSSHDHAARMGAHAQAVFFRRQSSVHHVIELPSQFDFGERYVPIPLDEFASGVEPAEIEITRPVAEPTAHLHQGVIHPRCAEKVTDRESFEGEAAGKLVAADGDHAAADRFVLFVVQRLLGKTVDRRDGDFRTRRVERLGDFSPTQFSARLRTKRKARRFKIGFPKCFEFIQQRRCSRSVAVCDSVDQAFQLVRHKCCDSSLNVNVARDVDEHGAMLRALASGVACRCRK